MSTSNNKIVLGYWALRGFGQPTRLLAAYLGIELDEKRYKSYDEWMADKFSLGLDFPNVPYLVDGDLKITESRAIVKYVARKYGGALYPSELKDITTCEIVENLLFDVWGGMLRYFGNNEVEPTIRYFENEVPTKLKYLDTFLENKKFVLGNQITFVDFFLYEMSYHVTMYKGDYLDKYSNLAQFKKRFEELAPIAKYIASKDYIKAPCVNPMGKIAF